MKPFLLLALWWLAPAAQAQRPDECTDLATALRQVSQSLDEVRLDDAIAQGSAAEQDLPCQTEPVNTLRLTTLYQLMGAVYFYMGQSADSELYFGKAVAVSPGSTLDPSFGERASQIYEDVRIRTLGVPTGSVAAADDVQAWLDGHPLTPGLPTDVAAGSHLIQVRQPDGSLLAEQIRVAPEQAFTVRVQGPVTAALRMSAHHTQQSTGGPAAVHPSSVWLGAGGGALLAGGVVMGLAAASHARFDNTTDISELDTLRNRTNLLGTVGLSLELAGAGLVGGAFLLPTTAGAVLGGRWVW